ncbi:hypothetical protein [Microcoleus sp.]
MQKSAIALAQKSAIGCFIGKGKFFKTVYNMTRAKSVVVWKTRV